MSTTHAYGSRSMSASATRSIHRPSVSPIRPCSMPPVVMAYPREVVIAKKFQAMVNLGMDNSRMKDYFDIDLLGRRHTFRGLRLARALEATFRRRHTSLPASLPPALSD